MRTTQAGGIGQVCSIPAPTLGPHEFGQPQTGKAGRGTSRIATGAVGPTALADKKSSIEICALLAAASSFPDAEDHPDFCITRETGHGIYPSIVA